MGTSEVDSDEDSSETGDWPPFRKVRWSLLTKMGSKYKRVKKLDI